MPDEIAQSLTEFLNDAELQLPPLADFEIAAQRISALFNGQDGATFSLYFGDMAGQRLFAVALYPDLSVVVPGRVLPTEALHDFIEDNRELLSDPRNSVGIWYSDAIAAIYLDVTTTLPDKQQAIGLGIRYNQEAVYDLALGMVTDTGGTGVEPQDLPSIAERLEPLERVHR